MKTFAAYFLPMMSKHAGKFAEGGKYFSLQQQNTV
jgi:hypothetical protein